MPRVFLLSPARCDGRRAQLLLRDTARFPLAARVRDGEATLGETFEFMSGLYFRGKLAYALHFGHGSRGAHGAWVITATRGLMRPAEVAPAALLREFSDIDIARADARYRQPLARDLAQLARDIPASVEVVLLGSIATAKYVEPLLATFGSRLVFPATFVGRGDMSRGALLLRAVRDDAELDYAAVEGAVRTGRRAPRIADMRDRSEAG